MKTLKKKGSFDNYILSMSPEKLNSKYGEYLWDLMTKKLENPDFEVGTIKLQAWTRTNWRKKFNVGWRGSAIYIPAHIRATTDRTQYMLRSPDQYTRTEYQQFLERQEEEKQGYQIDENEEEEQDGNWQSLTEAELLEDDDFRQLHEQCLKLQEARWTSMQYYWNLHKNNWKRWDILLKMMDESDAITKELLLSKFVSYKEKFPEMAAAAIVSE